MKIALAPVCFLLSMLLLVSAPVLGGSSLQIKLADYQFDPLISSPLPPTPPEKTSDPSGLGYYLLQFTGPVHEEWKELCRSRGVEFLDYIPDFAFIVRMNQKTREKIESLPPVRWVGNYQPAYRLPSRLKNLPAAKHSGEREYIVTVFPGADVEAVIAGAKRVGGKILKRTDSAWKTRLRIAVFPDRPEKLAALSGVKWVEEPPQWRYYNNKAREIMSVNTAWNNGGYFGAGQTVGVADSGLDRGSTTEILDDFKDGTGGSRVLAISTDWTALTDGEDINGHGTHVAGSILGNGVLSGANPVTHSYPTFCYAGLAPEASLIFQALGDLSLLPADLNHLFAQAYGGGARIHNNSWGSEVVGYYTSYSEDVDEFSWDNKDFLAVFPAGNAGIDSDADGVIDLYSVAPPATAKNCLAVGATENNRPPGSSPKPGRPLTYGWYWPGDYPSAPISGGYLSDNPDGMAAFSSRGAELSARWKPEVVAPGTNIISCRSKAVAGTGEVLWGSGGLTGAEKNNYVFAGGTSMSTSLVTGSATLVREYYQDQGSANPSAALIKATLINGAKDISPGQYGTGQYREIPGPPRPNNVAGWGRVDLSSTIFSGSAPDFSYFEATPGLSTGGVHSYPIEVAYSLDPLSVTLCWTDHPGSTPAEGALVNDLDLSLTGPDGAVYYPNNALAAGPLFYENGLRADDLHGFAGMIEAVRFTPERYPATLERGMFYLSSRTESYSKTIEYSVYRGDASGPGARLASGSTTLQQKGWHPVDLSDHGITIDSGDFYLALVLPDDDLSWAASTTGPIAGRSWGNMPMPGWTKRITHDYLFRAVVSTPTLYDRTNNTVGIDIDYPLPGTYTVTVKGYNVPSGPQPYALVASRPDRGGVAFPARPVIASGDYNGDGSSDIALFRPISGLWAVRDLTRIFFGGMGDIPASGDYNGDGTTDFAVFHPVTGLWAVRGLTRAYFGGINDISVPGDYNGDGRTDIAIFRESTGLWSIRGLTRFYLGKSGDLPVPGDYDSFHPGWTEAAVFRPASGLWAIRNLDRVYFGAQGDWPLLANFDILPGDDVAVWRASSGLWAIYDFNNFYYGRIGDQPVPADYTGQDLAPPAIFRPTTGLWAIRGLTRAYFGQNYDIPVTR